MRGRRRRRSTGRGIHSGSYWSGFGLPVISFKVKVHINKPLKPKQKSAAVEEEEEAVPPSPGDSLPRLSFETKHKVRLWHSNYKD